MALSLNSILALTIITLCVLLQEGKLSYLKRSIQHLYHFVENLLEGLRVLHYNADLYSLVIKMTDSVYTFSYASATLFS